MTLSRNLSENSSTVDHDGAHCNTDLYRPRRTALGDVTNITGLRSKTSQDVVTRHGHRRPSAPPAPVTSAPAPAAAPAPDARPQSSAPAPVYTQAQLNLGAEYDRDITDNLQRGERMHMARADYMETKQKDLSPKMRAILVDWLVEVHLKFKLNPETLFIATNLVDRFLSVRENLPRAKLQLVGVTCMLLAAKYEDVNPPKLRDFIYITDQAYTRGEILEMEERALNTLGFQLAFATPHRFLQRYARLAQLSTRQGHAAQYLLELCLPEYSMLRYPPSHLAAASLFLSSKIFEVHPSWPSYLMEATRYTAQDIKGCAKEICVILQKPESRSLVAIKKKFSHAKFSQVAKMIVTE
mmetsp:Transcript_41320/g.99153  ORF Transcript_41320/g.99153 Transcript_41320/m.99153 type:complete len:354 (+) Transcript_41320:55-1116(+)